MGSQYQIRADFDRETIVVYQAYGDRIAGPALQAQTFVPPFSTGRMSWIKPSFLWLMHRSDWAKKSNQTRVLAIRVRRDAWDAALVMGTLTSASSGVANAKVHVQWDPERSLRGHAMQYYSIQVGVSRHLLGDFVNDWIVSIEDVTPVVRKISNHLKSGELAKAKRHLPRERIYSPPCLSDVQHLGF